MNLSQGAWSLLAVSLAVAGSGAAEEAGVLLRQKQALVKRLLADDSAAGRIAASGNEQAMRFVAAAAEHHANSEALTERGEFARADKLLNEAMWAIGKARQMVPDNMTRLIELRVRYARLLGAVDALRSSFEHNLRRIREITSRVPVPDSDLRAVSALIEEAKSYATAESPARAVERLELAEHRLLIALNRLLGSTTLNYTERFETPAGEFSYELERHNSYASLVPIALERFNPGPAALRLVERYADNGRAAAAKAEQQAAKKDYRSALKSVRLATAHLQRALGAAGLAVPSEIPDQKTE